LEDAQIKYRLSTAPLAFPEAVIKEEKYRITVLTSRLLRLEYSENNQFNDAPTQRVIRRDFSVPAYRIIDSGKQLEVITDGLHMVYNKQKFSKNGLTIQVKETLSAYRNRWYYGEPTDNLLGTARTLDEADGEIPLEDGLLSRNGFAVLDDSHSICLTPDGFVEPARNGNIDLYFWGYGWHYQECLKDFYYLCGETPMLPRYAFGNWWSRFHRYDEKEYHELVNRFEKEGLPFSVAVLDMEWHLTGEDIDPKYGSGWTGYTWNRKLFPDPERFMNWLHQKNMHVTINVHPAEGVCAHEEMYRDMAEELGVDYTNEDPIPFDISDRNFLDAYFKYLHHPNEEIGVDFWWIDWQQGGNSKVEGLDPLWMLNHYHYLDNGRSGKRPMTFSRYAGIGSHRYPVGFSGDTFTTWESLDFQPYFTATAANAGYGYWSHDIGGHMHGVKSDEMLVRWMQFGVFSPIMRIHSSDNPFFVKEPWKFDSFTGSIMKRFLRLRHQMIPYIYTMSRRFTRLGEPLVQPMYYRYPKEEMAYCVRNQYYFGTELIVCPITAPMKEELKLGLFKGWLPEGIYYDVFTGRKYRGGRRLNIYRDITAIPVFAKAGAIVPLEKEESVSNAVGNPVNLEINIYAGASGNFELYEDDEDSGLSAVTLIEWNWQGDGTANLSIKAVKDEAVRKVLPDYRNYTFRFWGLEAGTNIRINYGEEPVELRQLYHADKHMLEISCDDVDTSGEMKVSLEQISEMQDNHVTAQAFELLDRAQINYDDKNTIFRIISRQNAKETKVSELLSLDLNRFLLEAIIELITAW
jgi:alpha-glucosidase (family GH31 glycosyl hydrolase)